MRNLALSIALAVALLGAAAWRFLGASRPAREAPPEIPYAAPAAPLPSPARVPALLPAFDPGASLPAGVEPVLTDPAQAPSQDRLVQELTKILSLTPPQEQNVRAVLERDAKKMTELLHAERDDAFAERLARARREYTDELLSVLTAEQQIALKKTTLWERMAGPPPVQSGRR